MDSDPPFQSPTDETGPALVPFTVTPAQARQAFLSWQRRSWLAPSDLLKPGTYSSRAAFLPFWVFHGTAHVQWVGTIRECVRAEKGGRGGPARAGTPGMRPGNGSWRGLFPPPQ